MSHKAEEQIFSSAITTYIAPSLTPYFINAIAVFFLNYFYRKL